MKNVSNAEQGHLNGTFVFHYDQKPEITLLSSNRWDPLSFSREFGSAFVENQHPSQYK